MKGSRTMLLLAACVAFAACGKTDAGKSANGSGGAPGSGGSLAVDSSLPAGSGGMLSTGGAPSSTGGAQLSGGSGGALSSGGTGGSGLVLGEGGKEAFEAAGFEVISELPPGVELVPGPTPERPPGPRVLNYSGYPEQLNMNERIVNDGCAECTENEFCIGFQDGYQRRCGWADPGGWFLPLISCINRPLSCHGDCPVVCGCDGKLYCNACIANAWGWHRNPVDDPNRCEAGLP